MKISFNERNHYMNKYEENRLLLASIIHQYKRGYMQILRYKHPELIDWIYEVTAFSDQSNRRFTTRIWYVLNELHEYPICKHCKHPNTKNVYRLTDPRMDFCSLRCSNSSEQALTKFKATSQKNYGTDHPMNSPIVKDRFTKSRCIAIAKRNANKPKPEPKPKYTSYESKKRNFYLNTICNNDYIRPLFSIDEYMNVRQKDYGTHEFLWQCKLCGRVFESTIGWFYVPDTNKYRTFARCYACFPLYNCASLEEKHLAKFVKSICPEGLEVINNKLDNFKLIKPYQVDIIVRDKLTKDVFLCIEYDGARWHSLEMGSEIDRQLNKTMLCESKGITLVHIYEDEWIDKSKRNIIEAYLKALLSKQNVFGNDDVLVVNRDKFPKTIKPIGYQLVSTSDIEVIKRNSLFNNTAYSVPNCGKLTYRKERT